MPKTLEVNYRKHPVNGGIVCNGWDSVDTMCPVFYHNLYQGYTLAEVKQLIKEKYSDRYKHFKFEHLPLMSIGAFYV